MQREVRIAIILLLLAVLWLEALTNAPWRGFWIVSIPVSLGGIAGSAAYLHRTRPPADR